VKLSPMVEPWRIVDGLLRSAPGERCGAFLIPGPNSGRALKCLVSDGRDDGWEHVSVSLPSRCPNWLEMSYIKDLFWAEDEWVVQFHPAKSDHINVHPYCLHMWRPLNEQFPTPPKAAV
jgi:hypothetical protein